MTGEDMIIKAAAELLREAKFGTYPQLRRAFWIAGRCEHCGDPTGSDGTLTCRSCGRPIVIRGEPPASCDSIADPPHWVPVGRWHTSAASLRGELGEAFFDTVWYVRTPMECTWASYEGDGVWKRAPTSLYLAPQLDPPPTHVLIPGKPEA